MNASIRNLTRFSLVTNALVALALIFTALHAYSELGRMSMVRDNALEWAKKSTGLQILSIEYILIAGKRQLSRWQAHHASMAELVQTFQLHEEEYQQIPLILDAYLKLPEKLQRVELSRGSPEIRNNYLLNFETELHFMVLSSTRLLQEISTDENELFKRIIRVTLAVLLVFMAQAFLQARLFRRWISAPLERLTANIRVLGKGDLEHPVDSLPTREFDRIARHLDDSRKRLQQLTISRETLEETVSLRTEALQARTLELETANRDLEGFSYSVSHNLRAPLRAIDGYIAIIREDFRDRLGDEALRLFDIVAANALKMGEMIDDILSFSRAGRAQLSPGRVNTNDQVDAVWRELEPMHGDTNCEFERDDLPDVAGDELALRQVWQNLLANAIKFSRGRQPARIEVRAQRREDSCEFSVRDNGVGFNQAFSDKLFVLFQRLHGMDEFEGTGAGLAICKRFVQKHGGRITAEGALDQGACFRFTLPLANTPPGNQNEAQT